MDYIGRSLEDLCYCPEILLEVAADCLSYVAKALEDSRSQLGIECRILDLMSFK